MTRAFLDTQDAQLGDMQMSVIKTPQVDVVNLRVYAVN
jgi:hypothetical protein